MRVIRRMSEGKFLGFFIYALHDSLLATKPQSLLLSSFPLGETQASPGFINGADLEIHQTRGKANLPHDILGEIAFHARGFLRPDDPQSGRFTEINHLTHAFLKFHTRANKPKR